MADIEELIGKEGIAGVDLAIVKMEKLYDVIVKDIQGAVTLTNELSNSRSIKDLGEAVMALERKIQTTTNTQKVYTQAMADAAVQRQKEIAALKDVSRETVKAASEHDKFIAVQKRLEKAAQEAWHQHGKNSQQFKDAAAASNKYLNELKALDATLGNARRNVGNYNNQLFSMTQVLRELPAFTYSAQTGMMALSNNLPILADEFQRVKAETGSTGAALAMFGKSLFSFSNIFAIGIGLFTIYYKEIVSFITGTKEATRSIKDMNEAFEQGAKTVSNEIVHLKQLYSTATNIEATYTARKNAVDELQKLYPAYLGNIKDEEIMIGNAQAAYAKLNKELINKAIFQGFTAKANKIGEELTPLLIELARIENQIESIGGKKGEKNKDGYFMTGAQSARDKLFLSELDSKATSLRDKIEPLHRELRNLFTVSDRYSSELTSSSTSSATSTGGRAGGRTEKLKNWNDGDITVRWEHEWRSNGLSQETIKQMGEFYAKMLVDIIAEIDNEYPKELATKEADALNQQLLNRKSLTQQRADIKAHNEQKLKDLTEYVQSAMQINQQLHNLSSAFYDRELQALDAKSDRLNELHNQEMQFIEQSGMSQAKKEKAKQRLEAETAAKQKKIDKDKRKATVEQAKLDKVMMALQIIGNTAIAVMANWAKSPALAIAAGAAGALQLATLAAATLPEYKDGRKGGKQELAIVSEEGQEGLRDKHGNLSLLPATKSIVLLPEGSDVIPAHEMIKNKSYIRIAREGGTVTPQRMQDIMLDEAVYELKGLRRDLRDKRFYVDNNSLIGYDQYIQAKIK